MRERERKCAENCKNVTKLFIFALHKNLTERTFERSVPIALNKLKHMFKMRPRRNIVWVQKENSSYAKLCAMQIIPSVREMYPSERTSERGWNAMNREMEKKEHNRKIWFVWKAILYVHWKCVQEHLCSLKYHCSRRPKGNFILTQTCNKTYWIYSPIIIHVLNHHNDDQKFPFVSKTRIAERERVRVRMFMCVYRFGLMIRLLVRLLLRVSCIYVW